MYTGVSLLGSSLTCSLFSVCSAAVCSVVGSTGSYSPGFISQSGRESDSVSISASVLLVCLVTCIQLFKVLPSSASSFKGIVLWSSIQVSLVFCDNKLHIDPDRT